MENRVRVLNDLKHKHGVLYVMNRDQRIRENYSVELGYNLSEESKSQFYIGVDLVNIKMNSKQKLFIFEGFQELIKDSKELNIHLLVVNNLKSFLDSHQIDCLIIDQSPLREIKQRDEKILEICKKRNIALYLCDSHNIVPVWLLDKYKRTPKAVRTDLYKLYNKYLQPFKPQNAHKHNKIASMNINSSIKSFDDLFKVDFVQMQSCSFLVNEKEFKNQEAVKLNEKFRKEHSDVLENHIFTGGYSNGMKVINDFFKNKFKTYKRDRNNPEVNGLSNISPWLHTGQVSAQQIIYLAVNTFENKNDEALECFVNELFIWRETAEHFVFHEPNYDNINGALAWAKETLLVHSKDKKSRIYSESDLEKAKTNDSLWNAAQKELLISGKIHGYVRMYWAKKILEWRSTPQEALQIALYLNDEYSLDGNDCNGYLGVMWSICGSMDRAFKEREIYGKIRYMRSFKCPGYILKWK